MDKLTGRQQAVLNFIMKFMKKHGYPPTRAEIATGMGFASLNSAQDYLSRLERKARIELDQGVQRGIRIIGNGKSHKAKVRAPRR